MLDNYKLLEARIIELEKQLAVSKKSNETRPREPWKIKEDYERDEVYKNSFTSGHYRGRGAY